MKITLPRKKSFLALWLIHAALFWSATNAYDLLDYYIRISKEGYYITMPDGSPYTVGARFYDHNVLQYYWAHVMGLTLVIELLRKWVYERRTFIVYLVYTAGACAVVVSGYLYVSHFTDVPSHVAINAAKGMWLVCMAYTVGCTLVREFMAQQWYRKEVRLAKSEGDLKSLRAQVNPHFFFNTFNYIYGTALRENANQTAKAVEMMSSMMRYSMRTMEENEVPLAEELAFIWNYIELQKIRIAENDSIRISVTLPENEEHQIMMIAPMLLVPLIENAFKYGISIDHPSFITISVKATGKNIWIFIENSVHTHIETSAGMGTGLNNIAQRLQLLYPHRHTFALEQSADKFTIHLHLMTKK